jgi:hypothetical protein
MAAVDKPRCEHCGDAIMFHPHWRDIVDGARTPQHEIDQAYADTDLPEGVSVPRSEYHNDPDVKRHIDMLERNHGWEHTDDHLPDPGLGLKGRITGDHMTRLHDHRTDREEHMRQMDVLLDQMNARSLS